ncbi:MAG: hypothetical protein FWD77_08550 [Betaproteobacteria bacterium]|nr:hypothetical protein [Betaproteobacteria bacterium]
MSPDHFLSLSSQSMRVFVRRRRRGVLERTGEFPQSPEGLNSFSAYLEQHRAGSFHLLVNLGDEHFHSETIPSLRGRERQSLLERKRARIFDPAALCLSISLGHEKGRREDERLLFAALPDSPALNPWRNLIRRAGITLEGIWSPSLLAPELLSALGIDIEHCLFLSIQDKSLRQTYCENGRLRFSRLTPLPEESEGSIQAPPFRFTPALARFLDEETQKLRHYLNGQRLLPREKTLEILVLAHPGDFEILSASLPDSDGISHRLLNLQECAEHFRIPPPGASLADDFHLHFLAHTPPRAHFADAALSQSRRLRRGGRLLGICTAIWSLFCLAFAAQQFHSISAIDRETAAAAHEAAEAMQRYEEFRAALAPLPIAGESLSSLTARHRSLALDAATPEAFCADLSRTLDSEPAIEIDSLEWKNTAADSSQQAVISGHLRSGAASAETPRSRIFPHFVDLLGREPETQVQVIESPAKTDSFRLRLTRTPGGAL